MAESISERHPSPMVWAHQLLACLTVGSPVPEGQTSTVYRRPPAQPSVVDAPEGIRDCRYQLHETFNEVLGDAKRAQSELRLDYGLWVRSSRTLELRVFRVRAKGRTKDYQVDLDSARPGDLRRVQGGADTLLLPEVAEAFALLSAPLKLHLDGSRVASLEGGPALRAALLSMYPPAARDQALHRAHVEEAFSDAELSRKLWPLAVKRPPSALGVHEGDDVVLSRYGLRSQGKRAFRVRSLSPRMVVEVKETFGPDGRGQDQIVPVDPRYARLAAQRSLLMAWNPEDPCFSEAAERMDVRADWTESVNQQSRTVPLDRTMVRTWSLNTEL